MTSVEQSKVASIWNLQTDLLSSKRHKGEKERE